MNGRTSWLMGSLLLSTTFALAAVDSRVVPLGTEDRDAIVLKNDGYNEAGGAAFLQQGFVSGEKAGVWVKVPAIAGQFKVDYFRVLIAGARESTRTQVFFEAGTAGVDQYAPYIPKEVANAANITPGPYWNDIPVMGADGQKLPCLRAGQLVGAAIEFTHEGLPSVFRDGDGMSNLKANTLFAVPGGWNYSAVFGLEGDWILRVVGHEAKADECR